MSKNDDPALEPLEERKERYWQALLAAREKVLIAEAAHEAALTMLLTYRTNRALPAQETETK